MENMKEKVWGLYTTFDNPESIEKIDEIDIWNKIDNLGGAIFWDLVYSTRRFGVEFSREPSATEHVERSESYNAWFRFWHDHFESMSPEVYDQFVDDKCAGKDISKYMPTGSWKDSLEEQSQKRLK